MKAILTNKHVKGDEDDDKFDCVAAKKEEY